MTVKKLIEKLNKFNPDGNAQVFTHYYDADAKYNDDIDYLALEEDADGKLVVVIHTTDIDY